MSILKQKTSFFNTTLGHVPLRLQRLYTFGFWALCGERVSSMRGNARLVVKNHETAKTKAWRLLKNKRWAVVIPSLLVPLGLVDERSVVCLDFSTFHGWQVLTFAVQTKKGRAVPVFFDIIWYPIKKDSQNIFITQTIEAFVRIVGCRPLLVMDRGFACPYIIKKLSLVHHPFIVRVKGQKLFRNWQNRLFKARNTSKDDQVVRGYTKRLRLVISDLPGNGNEPWYLVTNDFERTRAQIIQRYYYRFEIEEFFKDAKWLHGLEWVKFTKKQSITNLLWFILLGAWLIYESMQSVPDDPRLSRIHHHNVSFPKRVYEATQREKNRILFGTIPIPLPGLVGGGGK